LFLQAKKVKKSKTERVKKFLLRVVKQIRKTSITKTNPFHLFTFPRH